MSEVKKGASRERATRYIQGIGDVFTLKPEIHAGNIFLPTGFYA